VADVAAEAPLVVGARSTPAAVSEQSNRAAPAALMPMIRVMADPPVCTTGFCASPPELRSGFLCASAPYQSDVRKSRRSE